MWITRVADSGGSGLQTMRERATVDQADLRLDGDFSISFWLDVPNERAGAAGVLVSRFDPRTGTGFTVSAISSSGGYNGPGDELRISFGLDAGTEPQWIDCGRPSATSNYLTSLAVFHGMLYTGSTDGRSESDFAHVYRHRGGTDWEDTGQVSSLGARGVGPLVVHRDALYAATWTYDWTRVTYHALAPCRVVSVRRDRELGGLRAARNLEADLRDGLVRAATSTRSATTSRCRCIEASQRWELAEQLPTFAHPMSVHGGRLVIGTWENPPTVMRYDGRTWSDLGNPLGDRDAGSQVHSLLDFGGALHVGSWPLGKVSRYEEEAGKLDGPGSHGRQHRGERRSRRTTASSTPARCREPRCSATTRPAAGPACGASTIPTAGSRSSSRTWSGRPDGDLRMREWARVTSLAEHDGLLFGTVASCTSSVIDAPADIRGTVHAMRAGAVATTSDSLEPGRHHVAAVRAGSRATVFIDGAVAASVDRPGLSLPPTPASLVTGTGSLARTIIRVRGLCSGARRARACRTGRSTVPLTRCCRESVANRSRSSGPGAPPRPSIRSTAACCCRSTSAASSAPATAAICRIHSDPWLVPPCALGRRAVRGAAAVRGPRVFAAAERRAARGARSRVRRIRGRSSRQADSNFGSAANSVRPGRLEARSRSSSSLRPTACCKSPKSTPETVRCRLASAGIRGFTRRIRIACASASTLSHYAELDRRADPDRHRPSGRRRGRSAPR